jgi:hypothetical protein
MIEEISFVNGSRPDRPMMSLQVGEALERHAVVVGARYLDVLRALDNDDYLPNSRLMYDVNAAMFAHPEVAARRFVRHSRHESSGSRFIEAVAERFADDEELRARLRKHAHDESRHCLMFAALADRLAGGASLDDGAPAVEHEETVDSFNGDLANFLIATHTAEVRNLALLNQYASILSASAVPIDDRILHVIDSVHEDESRHVAYTAAYVSRELDRSRNARELFEAYTENYVRDSWAEVSRICGDLARHASGAKTDVKNRSTDSPTTTIATAW